MENVWPFDSLSRVWKTQIQPQKTQGFSKSPLYERFSEGVVMMAVARVTGRVAMNFLERDLKSLGKFHFDGMEWNE